MSGTQAISLNPEDSALLLETSKLWGTVQRENDDHRVLVTAEEWSEWEKADKSWSKRLSSVVDSFTRETGRLTETQRSFLLELQRLIASTKRMSEEELWARDIERQFDEAREAEIRGSFRVTE